VSGATPSLDVGSYNFFDSGTLTANITVSFASVPTNANWRYSFKPSIVGGQWDISTAVLLQNFSVSNREAIATGVFFKPDGTKLYVIGQNTDNVNEYDLHTAWDISTADFLQTFAVGTQETIPRGVFFKPDGTKMYVAGTSGDDVNEYNLSTAWDISTAVFLQLFSAAAQETNVQDVFFKPDGTKMYVVGSEGDNVNEYNLSTAWNVSSASYLQNFSVSAQDSYPTGIFFKPDGTKMYVVGDTGDSVYEYDLSTAWDISTASFLQILLVSSQETAPHGISFKPDGLKMYVIGQSGDDITEYDLGAMSTITLPAAVENTPAQTLTPDTRVTYEFFTTDGGTTVKLIGEEVV
jgi:DNA-binding beta-propeller fold protein YncE